MADDTIYQQPEFADDLARLAQQAYDRMAVLLPGWEPEPVGADTALLDAKAYGDAEILARLRALGDQFIDDLGALIGAQRQEATYAQASTTWTVVDTAGYEFAPGLRLAGTAPDGSPVGFVTTDPVIVPPGATMVSEVTVRARDAGAQANLVTGALRLIDPPLTAWVSTTLDEPTAGGADEQTVDDYRDDIVRRRRTTNESPVRSEDVEDFAVLNSRAVRALAIDQYKADTATTGVPGAGTVVPVDEAGEALNSSERTDLKNAFLAVLETGFLIYVESPTYTQIDVTAQVTVLPGADAAAVTAAAQAAVQDYLSPANWGLPSEGEEESWRLVNTVRYGELYTVINEVGGVDAVIPPLKVAIHGNALSQQDVTLPGVAPLTRPGTIAITEAP